MANGMTRRETLKRGLAAAGALALMPDWALPALAQGEVDVPFTDIPETFNPSPAGRRAALPRYPEDRRPDHADRSVLLHPALQQARARRGHVPPEGDRPGRTSRSSCRLPICSAMPLGRCRQRLRMLREQRARDAGAVVERPLHRRPAARRAAARRRRRQGARGGVLRRRQGQRGRGRSGRRRSRCSSSSPAASRSRTR